jgi:arylsulfatase A-like enzyme
VLTLTLSLLLLAPPAPLPVPQQQVPQQQVPGGGPASGVPLGPGATSVSAGRPEAAPLVPGSSARPNLVLILADDFGVDLLGAYGEGSDPPCTPHIDALAAEGLLFRNAWSNPTCSPTRAGVLTGRHGFRTGIGNVLTPMLPGLPLGETTLPELLAGYASTAVGKWHLAGNLGDLHPNASGFLHFAGSISGTLDSYTQWQKVVDGQASVSTAYATSDTTDDAIAALRSMPEPWFLYVAYNAPHDPFHAPPPALCSPPACAKTWCGNLPQNPTNRDLAKAMVEALDAELGRLLAELAVVDPQAYVVFMGDNGTAQQVSQPPFLPPHAKGTLFEGGINVPLIVAGPGVAPGECAALVCGTDLYATFAELGRVRSAAEDSVSLVPYFSNPRLALRQTVYSELFSPVGGSPPFPSHTRAVRDARYKLVRSQAAPDALYDLWSDPFETADLLPGLDAGQAAAYAALVAELVTLGVD